MANRLIFLYHVVIRLTDGGTGKATGTQAMVDSWGKRVGVL